jgi:arsenate reductase (glutaredoxin)
MKVNVYGIPNCGSVKKARTFLEQNNIDYQFHDFKKVGVSAAQLQKWSAQFGWENVLNRKGMTWRNLEETVKNQVINEETAISLMLKNTSAIKRPIIESGKGYLIGFDEVQLRNLFF